MLTCDPRLEIATGLQILSQVSQSTESLQLRAPHVPAELVMRATGLPAPPQSCIGLYHASNPSMEPAEDQSLDATN
jgi:hypothetical protein